MNNKSKIMSVSFVGIMLNKKERLELYKNMLRDFSLEEKDERHMVGADEGFCLWLNSFNSDIQSHLFGYRVDLKTLPELMKQRPRKFYNKIISSNMVLHQGFWWKPSDNKVRCEALRSAIKLCENVN